MIKALLLIVATSLALGCSAEVRSPSKNIVVDRETRDFASLEGRWVSLTPREIAVLPSANSVSVVCHRQTQTCTETIAMLVRETDKGLSISAGLLFPQVQDYQIVEWTETLIRAQAKPRAANLEILINLVDQAAERNLRETSERGAQITGSPSVEHWVLR